MNFDALAPFYLVMEWLAAGTKLQTCRLAFLDEIPVPRRILIAGEGHGRFLPECVGRFPSASITVIDSSRRMLEIARRKLVDRDVVRVNFIHADVLKWSGGDSHFDLIVTHFFLDCFSSETLAAIIARLATCSTADAHWLLADFQVANGRFSRARCQLILWILYRFFRISCKLDADALVSPDRELFTAGFVRYQQRTYDWGLLKSEWWRR